MTSPVRILLLACVALAMLITLSVVWNGVRQSQTTDTPESEHAQLRSILEQAVADESRTLPRMVDKETRLEGIRIVGVNTLRYDFALVNFSSWDITGLQIKEKLETLSRSKACADPGMRAMLDSGVSFRYAYKSKAGQHLADIDVSAADCAVADPGGAAPAGG